MKKKSLLLLLLTFVMSMVIGLVGCTSTGTSSSSESESELGSQLESETETESVIDSESESESETETESESELESMPSEEDLVLVNEILQANSGQSILNNFTTYLVKYDFKNGLLSGYKAEYFYDGRDEDGETLYAHHTLVDGDGVVVSATHYVDNARYSLSADGEYTFAISPEEDNNFRVYEFGFVDFSEYTLYGDVTATDDEFDVVVTFTLKYEDQESSLTTYYSFSVDGNTYLFTSAERKTLNSYGDVVELASIDFVYDNTDYVVNSQVIDHILNVEDGATEFVLVLNPQGESVTTSYAVANGVNIVMDNDAEGNTYTFYKNHACTKDIEDLDEILVDYNGATVYATITGPQFSFDFTLTEADIEQMNSYIALYLQLVETSSSFDEIEDQRAFVEDMMGYFVHQYCMGEIQYYLDISKQSGKDKLNFAQETYNDMYEAYIAMYRTVYEMEDNEYSVWMFADWTEEDLSILYQDNEAIAELETANTQIEQQFNDLESGDDWSYNVEVLYEQFVANNQQIAALHGYDNAYEYKAIESYNRRYSTEERAALIEYIKEYIIPFYDKANSRFEAAQSAMDQKLYDKYVSIAQSNVKSLKNKYISGYIDSYDNSLNQKMKDMYEKKAVKFALLQNSMGTAYVNYSSYYEEGFAFFGKEYQELLTVIHEMGHYVANSAYSLSSMGYDLAETHSQGNEWMMLNYLSDTIDADVFELMYSLRLVNGMSSIVYGILVDEFEYRVYTAETPYVAGEFRGVMEDVLDDLGIGSFAVKKYYEEYVQNVIIRSPVYYLNYVTSEITAMGFYTMAEEQGYEVAQEAYRKLQEDCDITLTYSQIVEQIGLFSPFEEESYIKMGEVFFPAEEEQE